MVLGPLWQRMYSPNRGREISLSATIVYLCDRPRSLFAATLAQRIAMTSEPGAPIPPKPPKRPVAPSRPRVAPKPRPRPKLAGPTKRLSPKPPVDLPPSTLPAYAPDGDGEVGEDEFDASRNHPIAPPDAAMQFRAIGLVEGRYEASEEQFTRGTIFTPDGSEIDAVLLGRVMSLVRKYLQPERDYMWVVYPRTGTSKAKDRLHVQIAGVWAPEEMTQTDTEENEPSPPTSDNSPDLVPNYFSVRGEVIRLFPEKDAVVVKIVQNARKTKASKPPSNKQKTSAFKLRLLGQLPPNSLGQFWDLEVLREDCNLKIVRAVPMGPAPKPPPKKRRKTKPGERPQSRGPREKPIIKKAAPPESDSEE